jgi:hypothetical protein
VPAFIHCAPRRTGRAGPVATTRDSPGGGQADTPAADHTTKSTGIAGDGSAYGPVLCTLVQLLRPTMRHLSCRYASEGVVAARVHRSCQGRAKVTARVPCDSELLGAASHAHGCGLAAFWPSSFRGLFFSRRRYDTSSRSPSHASRTATRSCTSRDRSRCPPRRRPSTADHRKFREGHSRGESEPVCVRARSLPLS